MIVHVDVPQCDVTQLEARHHQAIGPHGKVRARPVASRKAPPPIQGSPFIPPELIHFPPHEPVGQGSHRGNEKREQ